MKHLKQMYIEKVEWHLPMGLEEGENGSSYSMDIVSIALQDGKVLEIIKMPTERGMTTWRGNLVEMNWKDDWETNDTKSRKNVSEKDVLSKKNLKKIKWYYRTSREFMGNLIYKILILPNIRVKFNDNPP